MIAISTHVVTDRTVLTYCVNEWPCGVLTARSDGDVLVVEHVVTFPSAPVGTLPRMLQAGLAEAWSRGYESIVFCLPTDGFPLTPALCRIGERLGFREYAQEGALTWFVRYRD